MAGLKTRKPKGQNGDWKKESQSEKASAIINQRAVMTKMFKRLYQYTIRNGKKCSKRGGEH